MSGLADFRSSGRKALVARTVPVAPEARVSTTSSSEAESRSVPVSYTHGAVVDEHVDVAGAGGHRGGKLPYGGGVGEVAGEGVDAVGVVALRDDLLADAFGRFEGAGGEVDLGAPACEPEGESTPEVAAGGGDDDAVVLECHVCAPDSWSIHMISGAVRGWAVGVAVVGVVRRGGVVGSGARRGEPGSRRPGRGGHRLSAPQVSSRAFRGPGGSRTPRARRSPGPSRLPARAAEPRSPAGS